MTIPSWANVMVANYRRQFREKHGRETTVADETIWAICDEIYDVYDDDDFETQDAARVEEMLAREEK